MIELCELLDITVNELLSGEKVESDLAQQTAEENLLALKRKDEKESSKSRSLAAAILILIIAFSASFAIYASKAAEKRRELEHNQRALSGMYRTVGDNDVLTDEAQKIIHLITGSIGETFVFSYQAEDTAARIKLLCDTYEHGEKTESAVLLDHEFVKSDNNPFVFEDRNPKYPVLKEEILSGYPRHGYLFIDCNNRATACTDEYMVESKVFKEDGSVVEDFGRYESAVRIPGKFPTANYVWSYRFHLSEIMQSSGGKINSEDVSEGNPVLLFLYGDDYKVYRDNYEIGADKKTGKTAEEILSDQKLMNSFEMCNVFYCVIE